MGKYCFILGVMLLFLGCANNDSMYKELEQNTQKTHMVVVDDTIPKVTGIGGIFFLAENPQNIKDWYGENLGLAIDDFGSPFEFRNANDPSKINYLRWSAHSKDDPYFNPSNKHFMINYRVQNIEGLLRQLKENGVTIVDSLISYPYGKFVHVMDPEGSKI